ncbi:MAG TPA: histone-like nucleoid-structuring protein Lsr2 [Mycobacterium sp.]|nr:histone-like nucleoid-structuring protein Lsr2 [Mycobacterium sp.]
MTEIGGNIVKAVVSAARKITGREPAPEASAKKTPAKKTAAQKTTAKKAPAKKVAPNTTAKAAIRDWARRSGYKIAARGRIPVDVVDAYRAAHQGRVS